MQAYSEYKVVESRWFRELPINWNSIRAKWIFSNEKERATGEDEQLAASQKYGVIPQSKMMELNSAKVMLALKGTENFKRIKQNDFVISLRSFEGGIEHSLYDGCISPAYTVLRSRRKDIVENYFKYALKSKNFIDALNSTSEGIRDGKTITYEQFGELVLALPEHNEQAAIAIFLDRETARIDKLISEKQNFIKLLKEKRQALISHVVTKGLDPNVKMKDSGIEWIGEVPEHWSVIKFTHFVSIRNGQVDPTMPPWDEYTLIAPNHIETMSGRIIKRETAKEQGADSGKYLCEKGEVIHSKIRPALAKACLCEGDLTICSADMYPMTCDSRMKNEYLLWLILSNEFTRYAILESDRVAMPKINRESLARIKFPVPQLEEQLKGIEFIKSRVSGIEAVIEETNSSIDLLKEHRTALISAAVTGKIDVREQV